MMADSMNFGAYFPYHGHNLPAVAALLMGILFLFLVFKAGRLVTRLVLSLIAAVFFAGAYWWYTHISS